MTLSMMAAVRGFTEEEAERLFVQARWPNGVTCGRRGSLNVRRPVGHGCLRRTDVVTVALASP